MAAPEFWPNAESKVAPIHTKPERVTYAEADAANLLATASLAHLELVSGDVSLGFIFGTSLYKNKFQVMIQEIARFFPLKLAQHLFLYLFSKLIL